MGSKQRSRGFSALALAGVIALLLAGCATTSALPGHRVPAGGRDVGRDGPPADPAKLAVVRRWAAELRAGDLRGAAAYFHLPSLFEDGAADTVTIHTRAQAEVANATLTCGAAVISAFRAGSFIDVLFRLTARAGRGGGRRACGAGIGRTARTEFLIRGGQIVAWVRAPSLPGDPGVPGRPPHTGGGGGGGGGLPARFRRPHILRVLTASGRV
jgi:hypothetical protein